jgi:YggT family protein
MCGIVDMLFRTINILLLIRALMSWINPDPYNPIVRFIYQITEPILAPFRRFVPPVGMLDVSFIVAILVLYLAQGVILSILSSSGLCF